MARALTRPPLVGRTDEFEYAMSAVAGEGSGVVLAGPSGVGKSRLAAELVSALRESGFRTISCAATQATASIPFAAVAELLGDLTEDLDDQLSVLRGVASSLARDRGSGVVLSLDDAHLVDSATAALVHYLVTRGLARVIISVRSGADVPDAIVSLWKDAYCARLDLQALARAETDELSVATLGGPVDRPTLSRLWELSSGNPMFVRELIRQAVEDGGMRESYGYWRWNGSVLPSERLIDLVRSSVGRLTSEERHVLTVVAFGGTVDIASLEKMANSAAIDSLVERGLISTTVSGLRCTVSLAHPLYGEVARSQTSASEARRVIRILADDLVLNPRNGSAVAGRVGRWAIEFGLPMDQELLAQAAREAYLASDFALAAQLAQADLDWPRRSTGYTLGSALVRLDDYHRALAVFDESSVDPPTEELRARLAYARIHLLFHRLERHADAEAAYCQALESVADESWRHVLQAGWAPMLVVAGRRDEAASLLAGLVDSPYAKTRVAALRGMAYLLIPAGETERLIQLCDEGVAQAMQLRSDWESGLYDALAARTTAQLMAGRLDEAAQALEFGDSLNEADLDVVASSFIRAGQGRLALFRGQPKLAAGLLREAVGGFSTMTGVRGSWTWRLLAESLALLGDVSGAQAALVEAETSDGTGQEVLDRDGARAAAWVAVAAGEVSRALSMLENLASSAQRLGEFGYEAMILHDCLRLRGASAPTERLADLADLVDGPIAAIYAAHAGALAAESGVGLDAVSTDFERLGFALLAAEASIEAARAHRARGHGSPAQLAAARAQRLRGMCEGARTPALQQDVSFARLTSREHEIAMLAGRGLSSNDIATTISLSRRTVDNHLQRAYEKLGIRRREQLREVLELD